MNTTYVGGQVYIDYNSNKLWESTGDYSENGASGVTVYAYGEDGLEIANTTTDAAGGWAIQVGNGTKVRIEFGLPDYFLAAPAGGASKSCVAFATAPACDVNFGVHDPLEYCESDPEIITICNVREWAPDTEPQIVSVDFSDGGNSNDINDYLETEHPIMVQHSLTGNLWGLAYSKEKEILYTSTTYKKGTNVGPNGLGAIYYVDNSVNTGVSGNIDTAYLLTNLAAGSDPTNGNPDQADTGEMYFDAAFDAPGKRGLGGIALNGRGDSLWTVNLFTRKLVGMKLNAAGTAITGSATEVDMPSPASCVGDEIRPWALKWYRGKFYVGMVCSGEVTEDVNKLRAYVYTYTPGDANMSTNPVLDIPLNYGRETTAWNVPAEWNPWKTIWNAANPIAPIHFNASNQGAYPSPILSDIEFDKGDMILSFIDRFGDQFQSGEDPAGMINPGGELNTTPGGELLKAGLNANGTSWSLESDGTVISASRGTYSSSATATGAGPGGKEFYHDERYSTHKETSLGGIANLPGRHEVVTGAYDPTVTYYESTGLPRWGSGGLTWNSNDDGTITKAWEGYYNGSVTGDFGKGNGFGDVEAACLTKPGLQIGNRVWSDANNNGVQDAGEVGLSNLAISLYSDSGVLLASTTSDANGNYFFSKDGDANQSWVNTDDKVEEKTSYYVVFGVGQFASNKLNMGGNDYLLVAANQNAPSQDPTMIDSDATVGSISDPAFVQDMPFEYITTDAAGKNEQNVDVGFVLESILPVQLISFTGEVENCKVNLNWKVANQENFSHFEIETANADRNFSKIAEQSAAADQSDYALYQFDLNGQENYFRLKMVDEDGRYNYSNYLTFRNECSRGLDFSLFPNPASYASTVQARINSKSRNLTLTMFDAFGRIVKSQSLSMNGENQVFDIAVDGLVPGAYNVMIINENGQQLTKRLIVK